MTDRAIKAQDQESGSRHTPFGPIEPFSPIFLFVFSSATNRQSFLGELHLDVVFVQTW